MSITKNTALTASTATRVAALLASVATIGLSGAAALAADADDTSSPYGNHASWDQQVLERADARVHHAADCALGDDLTATSQNRHYATFGCALNANIRAMLANPGDLTQQRHMGLAPAASRSAAVQTLLGATDSGSSASGSSSSSSSTSSSATSP